MLYVSSIDCAIGCEVDSGVVIRDMDNESFLIRSNCRDLPAVLADARVVSEDVAGLFRCSEDTMFVTPVSDIELSLFRLLSNPHYYNRPKSLNEFTPFYYFHGWYNLASANGACSVASLLLNRHDIPVNTFGGSIEIDSSSVAFCVSDECTFAKYIRFDLESYDALQRLRTKYLTLDMRKTLYKSIRIEWPETI